jgi:hypothetical protein
MSSSTPLLTTKLYLPPARRAAALLAERYQAAAQDHLQYAQIEIRTLQALKTVRSASRERAS